jgi:hypothetical protein
LPLLGAAGTELNAAAMDSWSWFEFPAIFWNGTDITKVLTPGTKALLE